MPQIIQKKRSPTKKELNWCLTLLLSNMQRFNASALVKHAKRKSIFNRRSLYILARESELVGFLMYRIERSIMYIYEIHVDERYRGKGIGGMLLKHAFSVAEQGCRKAVLFVDQRNSDAMRFYVRNGMVRDVGEKHEGSGYLAYSHTRKQECK